MVTRTNWTSQMPISHSTAIFVGDPSQDTRHYGRTRNCILERKTSSVASVVLHLLKLSTLKTIQEFIRVKSLIGEFVVIGISCYFRVYNTLTSREKMSGTGSFHLGKIFIAPNSYLTVNWALNIFNFFSEVLFLTLQSIVAIINCIKSSWYIV